MSVQTESPPDRTLLGMPGNPAREPKAKGKSILGGGTTGEVAFNDSVMIVLGAWGLLFLLVYSLRHHNI